MEAGSLVENGIEYARGGAASQAYLAEKTVEDASGNLITQTYLKLVDAGLDGSSGGTTTAEIPEQKNAGFHNSFYRGKDISDLFTSGELYTRISSGDFTDLYVGDFFTATINSKTIKCRIAGFDIYLHNGDTEMTSHHAVIVPDEAILDAKMNSSNTSANGYSGSDMVSSTMVSVDSYLTAVFGDHLLSVRELVSNAMSTSYANGPQPNWTGAASGWTWVSTKAALMTEVEVYGSTILTSSGYDIGSGKVQLPLFRLRPDLVMTRFSWWLRCITTSTTFANVNSHGNASNYGASYSIGVRPRFLLG